MHIRIREKTLGALLAASLLPLLAAFAITELSTANLASDIREQTRLRSIESAKRLLREVVRSEAATFRRETGTILENLEAQRRSVAAALTDGLEADDGTWVLLEDLVDQPKALEPSDRLTGADENGNPIPASVDPDRIVVTYPTGMDIGEARDTAVQLNGLGAVLAATSELQRELIDLRFVTFPTGVHGEYPANTLIAPGDDPRTDEAYIRAVRRRGPGLNRPARNEQTGKLTLTASVPVYDDENTLLAVTGLEFSVAQYLQLAELPDDLRSDASINVVITSRPPANTAADQSGPAKPRTLPQTVASLLRENPSVPVLTSLASNNTPSGDRIATAEFFSLDNEPEYLALTSGIRAGTTGALEATIDGVEHIVGFAPLETGDDAAGLVVAVPTMRAIAGDLNSIQQNFQARFTQQFAVNAILFVCVLALTTAIGFQIASSFSTPLTTLAEAMGKLGEGDLDVRADVRSHDELGSMASVFNATVPKLRDRMRLRESLSVAREVQQRLVDFERLRSEYAKVLEQLALDVGGNCDYCDECGGDYLDAVATQDPLALTICVGDVTGHGIGSALLMTTGRALCRAEMYHGRSNSIPEGLNTVNKLLTADASDGKFMTLGIIRFTPDGIAAASAGHDDAEILEADGQTFRQLGGKDIPLAVDESWTFDQTHAPPLAPGELLILASDGLWEARNEEGEHYGKDRLRKAMQQHQGHPAAQIVDAIRHDVKAFRGSAPAKDDVTIIAVKAYDRSERTDS